MARFWSWLTSWRDTSTTTTAPTFIPEDDEHIQYLRKQRHDSEESTRNAKRDWADVSIQERLRGHNSGWQEKVR